MNKIWYAVSATMLTAVLLAACGGGSGAPAAAPAAEQKVISISGAWALYPLAQKWAEVYQAAHPEVRIDVSGGGAGKGMTDALAGAVDIGMVSRAIKAEETAQGALALAVTKDAVVPTTSAANPLLTTLLERGVAGERFAKVYTEGSGTWEYLAGGAAGAGAHAITLFTRSDACGAAQTWGAYLGNLAQEKLKGTGVNGDPGIAEAVSKNPLGLGYNNIGFAYDPQTRQPYPQLAVIPLDVNNNGKLDPEEKFYGTLDTLVAAINAGKFPSPPARDLYFVTKGVPARPEVAAFLRWVLNEGQREVAGAGYVQLPEATIAAARAKLGQ